MMAEKKKASATRINVGYTIKNTKKTTTEKVLGKYLQHAMELINYAMLRGWKMKGNYI